MATKTSDTAIKEVLEKALDVYEVPEVCIRIALAFIDGLKTGATQSELEKQNTRNVHQENPNESISRTLCASSK